MIGTFKIAKKEFRSYFSSPAAYIIIILFLALTGWFFTNTLFIDGGQAELRSNFNIIPFLLLFFVPALTMKMIAEEKKSGTLELLTTLPVTEAQIVTGKFLGSLGILVLAILLTIPNVLTIAILGEPDWGVLFSGYLGLILMGSAFTAIGLYTSSVTDNQIIAFIISFVILFFLVMVSNLLMFIPFPEFFDYLGAVSHYSNMLKGVVDSRDLIYFVSVTAVFLFGAASSIEKKQNFYRIFYVVFTALFLNVISFFIFTRFDLTEGGIYSLSEASRKTVAELDDKVIVKCFFSEELPPQMKIIPAMIRDNLEEYKAYSNGNFYYEFIEPSDEEFSKQIMTYQLPSAQVQLLEKDEFKVKKVFMGMVMLYEDKKEIIPFIQEGDLPALEYQLTSMIKKITTEKLPSVGILSGPGMTELESIKTVYQILSSNYVVSPVSATKEELDPDKLASLLIIGPKEDFSQEALEAIDSYLTGGGKIGFFIDKTDVNLQMMNVKKVETNLDSLMMNYGISVNTDLIGDKQAGMITMRQQKGFFSFANQIKYPFLPMITNLNRENPVTQKIDAFNLYFASSLDTTHAEGKGLELEIAARTSPETFLQSGNYNIMADRDINDYAYDRSDIPVLALIKGSFSSYFQNDVKSADTRMIVCGDAEFFAEGKMGSDENINLFLNLADWLTADEALISIRSKEITQRPLKPLSDLMKTVIKTLNIIMIPLFFAIIGVFRWYSGRNRKDFSLK